MKRFILLVCLEYCICFSLVMSQTIPELEVSSRIDAVTVYPTYAVVQRVADINLAAGEQLLVLSGLPGTLTDESVRARLGHQTPAQLHNIRVETWYLESSADIDVHQLEAQIKALETQDKELVNRISVLTQKLEFLKSISVSSAAKASLNLERGTANTESWDEALAFVETNMEKCHAGILEAEITRDDIKNKTANLTKKLQQIKLSEPPMQKTIYLGIVAEEPVETTLMVSYLMKEAYWAPVYELRAYTSANELELSYFGKVRQKTGEDWQNVMLTLSTARPSLGAQIPELTPWYIDAKVPLPLAPAGDLEVEEPRFNIQTEEAAAPEPTAPAPSLVESRGISVSFRISGEKSVQSGEEAQKILIAQSALPARFEYTTVPKLSPYVYLTAKGKNTSDYLLLGGSSSVYVDGDYIGKSYLKNIAPNEKLELSLGVDEGVRVERALVEKFINQSGVFKKKTEEKHVYKINVQNLKDQAVKVSVKDQIPISRYASIEIKDVGHDPVPNAFTSETGESLWLLGLQPMATKEVTISFTIVYPRGKRPPGLF